jgi:phosphopantetheinyl transferase (holo-ACP synthase)
MTSSTRSCEPRAPLVGCGVDCEAAARFAPMLAADDHPMPFAFTRAEVARARMSPFPARTLCASFCAKEAVFKALRNPYNFTDCELLLSADDIADLRLAPALCAEHGIGKATIEIRDVPEADGVVMAVVVLFASPIPR